MKRHESNPYYVQPRAKRRQIITASVIICRGIPIAVKNDELSDAEFKKLIGNIDDMIVGKIGRLKHVKKRCLKHFAWRALCEITRQCRKKNLITYFDCQSTLASPISQRMLRYKHIPGMLPVNHKIDSECYTRWFISLVRMEKAEHQKLIELSKSTHLASSPHYLEGKNDETN